MDGVSATATTLLSIQVNGPWQIAGVGDFTGDGKADILWRQTNSGQTSIWQMNGASATATTLLSAKAPADWEVGAVGDFTGDGKADIAWRTGSGGITDFNAGQGDKIDLTGVTFQSANGSIARLSDGHTITATNGYNWAVGDFI